MTGSMVRLRRQLGTVPSCQPGKPAAPRPGVTSYKLSSNQNPYPPLPSVLHAVQDAATPINRYPDMMVADLRQALARTLDAPAGHIATGPGSSGVLGQIIQATCDPAGEVVFAWRSFEAYPIITSLAGARPVQVPLDSDGRHRLDAMAAAITRHTRVVLICTPNNPTGPATGHDELAGATA
jgi:histidinol-phosphate aminotransferase